MALHFLFNKVLFGNLEFFLSGVRTEFNDFHSVIKRTRNGARVVCSGYEKNIGKIKRKFNKVVAESNVLFRVKNFEHCGSGVAAEVISHFIDLIQKDKRIFASCKFNRVHNASGHCADISFSVAADVGFIFYAAERDSGIFSSHCSGNVFCNGSFTDTGRTDKADYLAFDFRLKFSYRKKFKNSFLNFFKTVMIFIKLFFRFGNINLLFGFNIPGKRKAGIEISADNACFLAVIRHFGKSYNFFVKFILNFAFNAESFDFLFINVDLVLKIFTLAEFFIDCFKLFTKIIFTLVLVDLFFYLFVNIFFNSEDVVFFFYYTRKNFKTFYVV